LKHVTEDAFGKMVCSCQVEHSGARKEARVKGEFFLILLTLLYMLMNNSLLDLQMRDIAPV
jgi:hypothetical protein